MRTMKDLLHKLEEGINSLEFKKEPQNLYEPISYLLSLGGKRLRSMLVLLGYGLHKENFEEVIKPSLAVEVFHNFTLMHDDIMDEALLRRGEATVHKKWNSTVAILSGDAMLVKAYDLLLCSPSLKIPEIISKFNICALEVCEGQQLDMDFEIMDQVSEQQYLDMIRLKTAVLLGFSLELGGLLADAKKENLTALKNIGEKAGIGFQLMDDLLDVYGNEDTFGKQVGGDIAANKKTYLLIKALEMANDSQHKELQQWLGKKKFDREEKVQAIRCIYDEIGIFEMTQTKMNAYYDEAFELIDQQNSRSDGKQALIYFFEGLMKRER